MKGTPPLTLQRQSALPATQWSAGLGGSLRIAKVIHHSTEPGIAWEIRSTPSCVWVILTISKSYRLGIRAVFCPTGLEEVKPGRATKTAVEFTVSGGLGKYHVRLTFMEGSPPMLRLTSSLTPSEDVRITAAPRDLAVFDSQLEPYHGEGRLFTCQTGNSAAQSFFSPLEKEGATVFYFHNLSGLADYFNQTGAKPGGCVAGEWPEAGFSLPTGNKPLKAGVSVAISDLFVAVEAGLRTREVDAALMFLESLGRLYPLIPQPQWKCQDWPELAKSTMGSLTRSAACTRMINGKTYVEAYVGSTYKSPESMVQGALLVPLLEYAEWRGQAVPLVEELRHVPESFYDPKLGQPVRWLAGVEFTKEEPSEEEHRYRMDSWYLLHTVMNLGRMAELGMENAREVFFNSLPAVMNTAHHFGHDWPVFYDQRNLKVFKAETGEGKGGERDAPGLYIKIMLQAWIMTHERKYLDEAEEAARKLDGLAFGVLYQTNNTVLGAVALARLWRETGKSAYHDQSLVSMASTLSHLWLWHLGNETLTWMGLPPMHDAPYLAFYEEAEILAGLVTWQKEMREAVPESCALLIAEYHKHLLSRGHYYFPAELPEDLVVQEPREGVLKRNLYIPLEGLGPPGDQAGSVGQAVYGAAAPFILAAQCWHRVEGVPFLLFCSYPLFDMEHSGDRSSGTLSF